MVSAQALQAGFLDLVATEGNLEKIDVGRFEQTTYVGLEMEDGRAIVVGPVAANPLEDAETVVKSVSQNVDRGLRPVDELPVEPDLLTAHARAGAVAHVPNLRRASPAEEPSDEPLALVATQVDEP